MGIYYGGPLGLTLRFCGVAQVKYCASVPSYRVNGSQMEAETETDFNATVLSPLAFGSWLTLLGK